MDVHAWKRGRSPTTGDKHHPGLFLPGNETVFRPQPGAPTAPSGPRWLRMAAQYTDLPWACAPTQSIEHSCARTFQLSWIPGSLVQVLSHRWTLGFSLPQANDTRQHHPRSPGLTGPCGQPASPHAEPPDQPRLPFLLGSALPLEMRMASWCGWVGVKSRLSLRNAALALRRFRTGGSIALRT